MTKDPSMILVIFNLNRWTAQSLKPPQKMITVSKIVAQFTLSSLFNVFHCLVSG